MTIKTNRRGFTLMELLVTVMIIGVLAAFAVPQYMKSLETTKADDAVGMAKMAATANRMYALDHGNVFAAGLINSACNSAACSTTATDPCNLVACKYLAAQNWDQKAYILTAYDGTAAAGSSCNSLTFVSSAKWAACATRRTGGSPGTDTAPYNAWGYAVDVGGNVVIRTGSPTPSE